AHLPHQTLDRTTGDADALAPQLLPYLLRAVDLLVGIPHALNVGAQLVVPLGARRSGCRIISLPRTPIVGRRSNRQDRADRLDSVHLAVLIDEGHHHFGRRSSSACAKNADAFRKISFARFSSKFSRSSCLRRWRSSVVRPGRSPRSRSAWRTHRRKASTVQPSFSATDRIVAHWEG